MSAQAGNLHFRRARLTLEAGDTVVDTLLEVADRAYNTSGSPADPVDPPLGVTAASPGPADGTTPASRVMVIPQPPLAAWADVSCGEPYVDSTTGRVNVVLTNSGGGGGGCANVNFILTLIDDGATDPADIQVTEDTVGPDCNVTVTITWDAQTALTPVLLSDIEAALTLAGYGGILAGTQSPGDPTTALSPVDFTDPGTTWEVTAVCSEEFAWGMGDLERTSGTGGGGLSGSDVILTPQPAESPPNTLTGFVTPPADTFVCGAETVELNVLFWAPHSKCGPVKCDTYNAVPE